VAYTYETVKLAGVRILESLGAGPEEAEQTMEILLSADLRGIPTHGAVFLPMIAERAEKGVLQVSAKASVVTDSGSVLHLDGGNGLGQPAALEAMIRCIEKAEKSGVGMALVRNTNHIGLLGYYSAFAAARGMVGFCMCNGAPSMAPWGGAEAFFGTNPFSAAVPRENAPPIVLDMSTSVVARGKIRRAVKLGTDIPPGWAFDQGGNPTTNPKEAMKGTLMPIAGPKGSGMAMMIDILCGVLSGSKFGKDLLTFHQPLGPTGVGVMTLAVDIRRFMDVKVFARLVQVYAEQICGSRKTSGNSRIYIPGEIEYEKELESRKRGLNLDGQVVQEINRILDTRGISEVRLIPA
jgi:LDH2 family malate/lactate/ureidoglycolate dehydrogenase